MSTSRSQSSHFSRSDDDARERIAKVVIAKVGAYERWHGKGPRRGALHRRHEVDRPAMPTAEPTSGSGVRDVLRHISNGALRAL